MFEKFAEDVMYKVMVKLALLKEANTLRDAVRMGGRISPKNFQILRNKKTYVPFAEYTNMSKLDRATYRDSLLKDLKSQLRGSGRNNNIPSQFDSFMKNDFNGDFTEQQYNKFFGNKTHYPSQAKMVRGITKGVYNRAADINSKIDKWNNSNRRAGKALLPKITFAEPGSIEKLINFEKEYGLSKEDAMATLDQVLGTGAGTYPGKKHIAVKIPSTTFNEYGTRTKSYLEKDIYPETFSTKGRGLPGIESANRAIILDHEFNEALNVLNQMKNKAYTLGNGRKGAYNTIQDLFKDSHASADVIGNEYMTNNAIFGNHLTGTAGAHRAFNSMPATLTANANSNLSGQSLGIDYSQLGGGISNKFKNPKQFRKFMNKIKKNEIKAIKDDNLVYNIQKRRAAEIAAAYGLDQDTLSAMLAEQGLPSGPADNSYIAEKAKEYFPHLRTKVVPKDVDAYSSRLKKLFKELGLDVPTGTRKVDFGDMSMDVPQLGTEDLIDSYANNAKSIL